MKVSFLAEREVVSYQKNISLFLSPTELQLSFMHINIVTFVTSKSNFMITKINATNITLDVNAEDPGGGFFSYMIYTADTGMCRRTRYGF